MQDFSKRIIEMDNYLGKIELTSDLLNYYKGRKILVTGGAGAIGSNLVVALSELVGSEGTIIVLDNLSSLKENNTWNCPPKQNVLFVEGDIREDGDLKRVFKENIDLVFHLAAFFANQNSIDYPEMSADVDVLGIIKLLEYSRLAKVDRFVYASSGCAIYGSYPTLPISEDFVSMHLTTPYQINKMTGEMYCNFYSHHYGLDVVNCRFFNSYGPGEIPGQYRNVIPNFIYWAMKQTALPLTGTGEETRDFTSVFDLVQGLLKGGFAKLAVNENFNLASGTETRIVDLIDKVNEVTLNSAGVMRLKRRKWDTKPRLLASIEKAEKLIGYSPIVEFDAGFQTNVEWFKDNWEMIEHLADFAPGMSSAVRGKA